MSRTGSRPGDPDVSGVGVDCRTRGDLRQSPEGSFEPDPGTPTFRGSGLTIDLGVPQGRAQKVIRRTRRGGLG